MVEVPVEVCVAAITLFIKYMIQCVTSSVFMPFQSIRKHTFQNKHKLKSQSEGSLKSMRLNKS